MVTPLRSGQGHTSARDTAEVFISIHALGRERLLVLSCGLPHILSKFRFCLSFLHTSRQICF